LRRGAAHPEFLDELAMPASRGWGNQHLERLADELRPGGSEHLGCGGVGKRDLLLCVDHDDGVGAAFDDVAIKCQRDRANLRVRTSRYIRVLNLCATRSVSNAALASL
jgi:hypothetical protein